PRPRAHEHGRAAGRPAQGRRGEHERGALGHPRGRRSRQRGPSGRPARVNAFFGWFSAHGGVLNPEVAVSPWGYPPVFILGGLCNGGVPVPEESVLLVAGFLVWTGQLRLDIVLVVGVISAVVGDNIGYWLGRRFGRVWLERHAHWILGHPERLGAMQRFMGRRGATAVIIARFLPGLRFMAGPLPGAPRFPSLRFFLGHATGRAVYPAAPARSRWAAGY